ncbi:hypothetical protein QBC43DRAFT_294130 [Cladorrhinum sp. PSN259]|nr:hypothetical protein QBC43DRAFT_294130 [Cladorrhinum sp. PSN259]
MLRSLSSSFRISGSSTSSTSSSASSSPCPSNEPPIFSSQFEVNSTRELGDVWQTKQQLSEGWTLEYKGTFASHSVSVSQFPAFPTIVELPFVGVVGFQKYKCGKEDRKRINKAREMHARKIHEWRKNTEEAIIKKYVVKKNEILRGEVTDSVTVLGWRLNGSGVEVGGRVPFFEDGFSVVGAGRRTAGFGMFVAGDFKGHYLVSVQAGPEVARVSSGKEEVEEEADGFELFSLISTVHEIGNLPAHWDRLCRAYLGRCALGLGDVVMPLVWMILSVFCQYRLLKVTF